MSSKRVLSWPVSRIRWRLATAIVVTALIPLIGAVLLARDLIRQSTSRFSAPEIAERLDASLELYRELAAAVKERMRASATAIARDPELLRALSGGRREELEGVLREAFVEHQDLVQLTLREPDQELPLAQRERGVPIDPTTEHALAVERDISISNSAAAADEGGPAQPSMVTLEAVFATPRARFDGLTDMSAFVDMYKNITRRSELDNTAYLGAFAVLLGATILVGIAVGSLVARGVAHRLGLMATATARAGAGDLSVRVAESGHDELAELARAFNRMLHEIETSRGRIEYLQRIAAWQEMARRLAHEIKNPLTPIQLAIQELHRRYSDGNAQFQELLDTSVDIVESEVATLRRLVSEFSGFARLPSADLLEADLSEFLREQERQFAVSEEDLGGLLPVPTDGTARPAIEVKFQVPAQPAPALLDEQMLRRALVNLIRNAVEAVSQGAGRRGRVLVSVQPGKERHVLSVEDDGPGIPSDLGARLFEPYVTSKRDGTGLGLAIVKKIVMEHGGEISAGPSAQGGARFEIVLPARPLGAGSSPGAGRNLSLSAASALHLANSRIDVSS